MTNFTLQFGKYKGQQFLSTPASYQNWLTQQDWFKIPTRKSIKSWGVYYIPNKEGRMYANLSAELISQFDDQERAIEFCDNCNMSGYLDELHSGYSVQPIW
jgi:hypothetical protein